MKVTSYMHLTVRVVCMALTLFSCREQRDEFIRDQLTARMRNPAYRQIAVIVTDSLTQSEFVEDLDRQIADWRQQYQLRFEQDFDSAFYFFSQEHVRKLHERKLEITDIRDSIALVYDYLNSFVNENTITGQYLDELAALTGTRQVVEKYPFPLIWITLHHRYVLDEGGPVLTEQLYFFYQDSIFAALDTTLTPLEVFNMHQFSRHQDP